MTRLPPEEVPDLALEKQRTMQANLPPGRTEKGKAGGHPEKEQGISMEQSMMTKPG